MYLITQKGVFKAGFSGGKRDKKTLKLGYIIYDGPQEIKDLSTDKICWDFIHKSLQSTVDSLELIITEILFYQI